MFIREIANSEHPEKISNLFFVENNDNYNLRINNIDYTLEKFEQTF